MKYLKNERGNSFFYILWLLGIVFIMLVIVLNIAKVYVVKQQADTAVEQAAIAGTKVLITKTKEAIARFYTEDHLQSIAQVAKDGKTIDQLIEEKKLEYKNYPETVAYIKALDAVLPDKIDTYSSLKQEIQRSVGDLSDIRNAVQQMLIKNEPNPNNPASNVELSFKKEDYRLEVQATFSFESISDNKIVSKFLKKVPQKGYGASLIYLKNVFE